MIPRATLALFAAATMALAQVQSPVVTKAGQVDASDLSRFARGICEQAGAKTDREKAEAIWRFFLTDGRFVKPGFWYHIAGWAYEEPGGEVLDAMKLLNSYGFGLCYHIAPLLEAVYEAAGFTDARVWFLTGHTVAEVFYDGGYHYFDSDMLGYNAVGSGPLKQRHVASVHELEQDGRIITGTLLNGKADPAKADEPWYPADVRAHAIGGLAELFTSRDDNYVYPFTHYAKGHSMDFVLRPGEKIIRYFNPEQPNLYYLPYACDDKGCREFPKEIAQYGIRTEDGPRSQKDSRTWATGRIEYTPPVNSASRFEIAMPSPYVIIDAAFEMQAAVPAGDTLHVETSTDGGRTWKAGSSLKGPHQGLWKAEPAVLVTSEHGRFTTVSGTYGYVARFSSARSSITGLALTTRFQLNPRTLPALSAGNNELSFRSKETVRVDHPVRLDRVHAFAAELKNVEYSASDGQGYLRNSSGGPGTVVFALSSPDGASLAAADIGGRLLDLRSGLAPDKLTAETRSVGNWPSGRKVPSASIAWSSSPAGPWKTVWSYNPDLKWRDGQEIDRTLRWPEVDVNVSEIPAGVLRIYVRYSLDGMALDDVRLASVQKRSQANLGAIVTHLWSENGSARRHSEKIETMSKSYSIDIPAGASVKNIGLIIESLRQ